MRYRPFAVVLLLAGLSATSHNADADTIDVGIIASFTGSSAQLSGVL